MVTMPNDRVGFGLDDIAWSLVLPELPIDEQVGLKAHIDALQLTDVDVRFIFHSAGLVRKLDEGEKMNEDNVIHPTNMGYVLWGVVDSNSEEIAKAEVMESLTSLDITPDDVKAVNVGNGRWRVWVKYNEGE